MYCIIVLTTTTTTTTTVVWWCRVQTWSRCCCCCCYCTYSFKIFSRILMLSVSACFSVLYWHPKFKLVKPGFLPAHKPGFTGLKMGRLPGFSGTQVAFPSYAPGKRSHLCTLCMRCSLIINRYLVVVKFKHWNRQFSVWHSTDFGQTKICDFLQQFCNAGVNM